MSSPTVLGEHVVGEMIIGEYPGEVISDSIGSGVISSPTMGSDGFTTRSNSIRSFANPTLAAPSHMTDQYDSQGDRILHRQPVN